MAMKRFWWWVVTRKQRNKGFESVLMVTGTSQDMRSCHATDCMVVMHSEYEDVSIERGLW